MLINTLIILINGLVYHVLLKIYIMIINYLLNFHKEEKILMNNKTKIFIQKLNVSL